MQVVESKVKKLRLTGLDRLSPIEVILEDYKPCHGEVIIKCDGETWSNYWGAMGSKDSPRTIEDFFCSCDNGYLIGKLANVPSSIANFETVEDSLKKIIIKERMSLDLDRAEARELWEDVESVSYHFESLNHVTDSAASIMSKILGDEWWYSVPDKPNPEYDYLSRIVNAVREGLSKQS